jgi:UDP-N-acetylmuramoyl-tripeptide--D-alanyl-D-alanine ligase
MPSELEQIGLSTYSQLQAIKVDSRKVMPGDIFVALRGGHQFIAKAYENGASIVIAENGGTVDVPDTVLWLKEAARLYIKQLNAVVIGVTGSVGKTTLTQSLRVVLSNYGKVIATQGNQNNEIGCALTILKAPLSTEYLILEMGVAKPFDMDYLVDMVQPDIAVITEIGATHLQDLNSNQGIWAEKIKISAPHTQLIYTSRRKFQTVKPVLEAYYDQHGVMLNQRLVKLQQSYTCRVSQTVVSGVIAVLNLLGLKHPKTLAIESVAQRACLKLHSNGAVWIDDSYNASLMAYFYALEALSCYRQKKVLVAGEMGGLGAQSAKVHQFFVKRLNCADLEHVIFYGPAMYEPWMSYLGEASFVSDEAALDSLLNQYSSQDYVVWIKGSRHLKMESIL